AILFVDFAGFSKLSEEQVSRYPAQVLGMIAELHRRTGFQPVERKTWGDGLLMIFDSVRSAGCFALELEEMLAGVEWGALELPGMLRLRAALHVGPVSVVQDPVEGRVSHVGTHLNLAARLLRGAGPGRAHVSGAFAALACVGGVREFTCEFVRREQ